MTKIELPEKGVKRLEAITNLGLDDANADFLLELINTEKGKNKTAATQALAKLNCDLPEAKALWKKLVKGKYMGESVLMPSCSDAVSDAVADVIEPIFRDFFKLKKGTKIEYEQKEKLDFCISLMLGKHSDKMLDVYHLLATNTDWIAHLKHKPPYGISTSAISFSDSFIKFYNPNIEEMAKVIPCVLAVSIVGSKSPKLITLANDLYKQYGKSWLIPVFVGAILTEPKETVYDNFSKYLKDKADAVCIYNALGFIYFEEVNEFARPGFGGERGYKFSFEWGSLSYGTFDTRLVVSEYTDLDIRWLYDLSEDAEGDKPIVNFQSYSRGGVKYEDYDEMLLSLLPHKVEDEKLKNQLKAYFTYRSKFDDGETSLYKDALHRFA